MEKERGGQKETSGDEEGTRRQSVLQHSSLSLHCRWTEIKLPLSLLNSLYALM